MSSNQVLRVLSARISFRLKRILFPIDIRELIGILPSLGYTVLPQVLQALPGPGMIEITHMTASGPIARKGNLIVDINSDKGFIGVGSSSAPGIKISIADIESAFNEIERAVCDNFDINQNTDIWFYEMLAKFDCEVKNNILKNKFTNKTLLTRLGNIIGKEVTLYGIRLVPSGAVPNQEEWFDITIQPHIYRPNKIYQISVIYRSPDRNDVLTKFKNLETTLSKIIEELQA